MNSGRPPVRATRSHHEGFDGYPNRTSAEELLARAAVTPRHVAVIDAVDGTTHDYGELARDVRRLAAAMRARGVRPGDVVGLQLPNWYETLVVVHATAYLGAVLTPIVAIYREREVGFILRQARPVIVFAAASFRGFDHVGLVRRCSPDPGVPVVAVRAFGAVPDGVVRLEELLAEGSACGLQRAPYVIGEDIALLLYTSGTTAEPKGVLHSHRTLGYEVRSFVDLFDLASDDSVFMPSPLTHITGLLYGALLPVVTGCAVTLLDVWNPIVACDAVLRDGCRFVMGATPFLLGLVEQQMKRDEPCPLRVFACGGADVPPALVRRATDVLGAHVARVYGSSEFPTLCCGGPADGPDLCADTDGRPIGPVFCRIDNPGPDGVGELLVAGPELFLGYLDPDLNSAAFTADGMFRTGDLALIGADGAVTIRGRSKDIIVRGGENISAREVEELLTEHPAVTLAAVVAMPDPVLVERVCAFVVPVAGSAPSVAELGDFLSARGLARQKHPERVELISELPLTASGKVQKFVLRDRIRTLLDTATATDTLTLESR